MVQRAEPAGEAGQVRSLGAELMSDRPREFGWCYTLVLVVRFDLHLSIREKREHKRLVDIAHTVEQRRQVCNLRRMGVQLLVGDSPGCFLMVVKDIYRIQKHRAVTPLRGALPSGEMPYGSL